jgi:hypothetical protein
MTREKWLETSAPERHKMTREEWEEMRASSTVLLLGYFALLVPMRYRDWSSDPIFVRHARLPVVVNQEAWLRIG